QNYTATIQTTGASGNLGSCFLAQGGLPPGIQIGAVGTSCILAGTPSNQGTYQFQVQATDSQGRSATPVAFSINVSTTPGSGGLVITTPSIPNGSTASPYLPNGVPFVFTASGGTGIYSWFLENGNLPNGLSLAQNGTLSGTPTQSGTFNFTIRVVS